MKRYTRIGPNTIIEMKPKWGVFDSNHDEAIVLVDRGEGCNMRYVVATANERSIESAEWYWGYYFATLQEARDFYIGY